MVGEWKAEGAAPSGLSAAPQDHIEIDDIARSCHYTVVYAEAFVSAPETTLLPSSSSDDMVCLSTL